ncbi:MAG: carbon-nitrogen hydrolase family protein [Verrucomicrobia bacterium]|nr:carbon-nitrogen hydrolase family protein [Verrucomicrobiota bacterium]
MPSVKLALAQMLVRPGEAASNVDRALDAIARAARERAQIVLLPEALDFGWTHPHLGDQVQPVPEGAFFRALAAAARKARVYVCAGLTEADEDSHYNTAVLIDPEGRLLLKHRKLNELEIGHACYGQGAKLETVRTPLGTLGVMICADAFAPGQVLSRALGYMGAELILSPCAWAVPSDHDNQREPYGALWRENYGPVARDFRLWIAGVSSVGPITAGPWQGRRCIGCSLLVNPQGEVAWQGEYGESAEVLQVAEVEIEPRPTRGDGWNQRWHGSV